MIEGRLKLFPTRAGQDLTGDVLGLGISIIGMITPLVSQAAGLLRSKGSLGQGVSVVVVGITKARIGAAISTPGIPIKLTTSGYVVAASSGDNTCGRYWSAVAANSGDMALLNVDFRSIGYWRG